MIKLYCKLNHHTNGNLCPDCKTMFDYVMKKLDRCPFDDDKPTCLTCTIHCYKSSEREKIRQIMRFSGPKMLTRHPILAILHLIDNKKSKKAVIVPK